MTLTIVFFLFLLAPTVLMLVGGVREEPNAEKRTLSPWPVLSGWRISALHKYTENFEAYFNDHFGFRNHLILLNSLLHVKLLGISPTDRVVLGRRGWLFYNSANDGVSLPDYEGRVALKPDELIQIRTNMLRIKSECQRRGIEFLVVVTPNKHTIYPEFLPPEYLRGAMTRMDQIKALNLPAVGVPLLDLRLTLRQAKAKWPYPLYYQLDTHWNDLGAFLAYSEIMQRLRPRFPKLKILTTSDFKIKHKFGMRAGDLAGFINLNGCLSDHTISLVLQQFPIATPLPLRYSPDPKVITVGYKGPDSKAPRLLMFRDSFTSALIPYLAQSFSESKFYWMYNIDGALIDQEHPDIIILQIAERYVQFLSLTSLLFPESIPTISTSR